MKLALGVEYDGSQFHGWQKQSNTLKTVQTTLEKALGQIAAEPVSVVCAGRTDTGVHALAQVVHFTTDAPRKLDAWTLGGNSILSPDVRILWAETVDENFSARFSALSRTYQYIIYNNPFHSALLRSLVTWEPRPLNADTMHAAAQILLGEHDFSSFRSSQCQSLTPFRNVHSITVLKQQAFVIVTITANAFLHHMVRNIVGALMEVGKGKQKEDWIECILNGKNRVVAGGTAPANGLYLVKVDYPGGVPTKNHARYMQFTQPIVQPAVAGQVLWNNPD